MVEKDMAEIAAPRATGAAPAAGRPLGGAWPALLLAGYGLAYFLVRMRLSGALELDEAEIVYLTQELRPGYGTQPPLYAWLQWLAFALCGTNRIGLLAPKILLLMACYGLMFRAARPLLGVQGALAAAAALALFPQIGWEFLRIQTHSVLATALACAILCTYFALLRDPHPWRWLAMGLLCGLGLQAKYNVACLLLAVLAASLAVPAHRRALWSRRSAPAACAALALALLVLAPHAAWMVQHPEAAFGGTVRKMQDGMAQAAYPWRVAAGLGQVLGSLAGFALLPALAFVLAAWPQRRRLRIARGAPTARFFLWLHAILLAALGLLAFSGEVGTIKERWMTPLFFALPLAAFVLVPGLRTRTVYVRVRRAGIGAALACLALLPLRQELGAAAAVDAHPYVTLAQALRRACPQAAAIVTDDLSAAGNLRFADPARRVILLDGALGDALPSAARVVLATKAPLGAPPSPGRQRIQSAVAAGAGGTLAFDVACRAPRGR